MPGPEASVLSVNLAGSGPVISHNSILRYLRGHTLIVFLSKKLSLNWELSFLKHLTFIKSFVILQRYSVTSQLVPKSTRTLVNSYLLFPATFGQLVP